MIKELIKKHLVGGMISDEELLELMKIGQFEFTGLAYRVIVLRGTSKYDPGGHLWSITSWSKSFGGIKRFLRNEINDGCGVNELTKAVLLTGKVCGFDLCVAATEFNIKGCDNFIEEEELLVSKFNVINEEFTTVGVLLELS